MTRAPPLNHWITYLSLNYAIRLTFSLTNYALRPITDEINKQKPDKRIKTTYPSLHYPLRLLRKIISSDIKLEEGTTLSPKVTFPISCSPISDKRDVPHTRISYFSSLVPDTLVLYTDGSKTRH